jgi:hypothetical protein
LSRSIALLAGAIRGLAADLSAIRPPRAVAALHTRLIAIVRWYGSRLDRAAALAGRPGGELRAANALLNATTTASNGFTATVASINARLR